jgi:hypothetical protein
MKEFTEELFNQMNFKELEAHIIGELGIPIILTHSLKEYRGRKYASIKSQNLAGASGIFSRVMDTVHIQEFNSKYQNDGTYWISVSYRWKSFKGGFNGTTLFEAVWHFDKNKWEISK